MRKHSLLATAGLVAALSTLSLYSYDRQGHLLYAWGALGDDPGAFLNMHGASVDPEGKPPVPRS